jgi:hypothetical protein
MGFSYLQLVNYVMIFTVLIVDFKLGEPLLPEFFLVAV